MDKVSTKIPREVRDNTNFLKEFHGIVWSANTEPHEFEQSWNKLMDSYDLSNIDWFTTMFEIRKSWLPAYFRDVHMSGLFRTTSMSESMNNFFSNFANARADLVEFLMHFDSAMDKQRYDFDKMAKDDMSSFPVLKTHLSIEKHAASVFTASIFNQLQHSIIKACYKCSISNISVVGDETIYAVDEFHVTYNSMDESVYCSCNKFIRMGLICSHMFTIFKNLNIEHIPKAYIVNRWRKDACSLPVHDMSAGIISRDAHMDPKRVAINRLHSSYYSLIGKVEGDVQKINALTRYLDSYNEREFCDKENNDGDQRREVMYEEYYGSKIPSEISVQPPNVVKTKGSGSRLISRKEKITRMMNKPLRKCSKCGEMARHDARNCDKQKDK